MPTYQYACTECGHRLEAVQSFSDDALTVCPECAGRLRKLFSAVGVVFKGSGFYRTDSRAAASASTPSAPTTPAADSAPKTPKQGGGDSAPAAKPAATPAPSTASASSSS